MSGSLRTPLDGVLDCQLALRLERVEPVPEGHGLGLDDESVRAALGCRVELGEDVAWIAEPPFDVGPDRRFEGIGPQ